MYCLRKILTPKKSVIPIVSVSNTPTYHLSKWLGNEYKNLTLHTENLTVQNSIEFLNQVNNIQFKQGNILVSFDVCLFFQMYLYISKSLKYLVELLKYNNNI